MNQSLSNEQNILTKDYKILFQDIKKRILSSQIKASISINKEMISLYWEIGSKVYNKQKINGWGTKTIEKLAKDLKSIFLNIKGFSLRNIKYMVHFAKAYPDFEIRQQVVAQIPWGHNILLLQKLNNIEERLWYANKIIENGWSRNVLHHFLDSNLIENNIIRVFQTLLLIKL